MIEAPHNLDLTFKDVPGEKLMRRVQGFHDLRLDGVGDILSRANGATVFDIGSNRGLVGYEFAKNGASRVMGCDIDENCVIASRHVFADLRYCPHRFEVVDLAGGEAAIRKAFGPDAGFKHDIVVMLATYHKLKRVMPKRDLDELMKWFGSKTAKFFVWRGYEEEIAELDKLLGSAGLIRVQTSILSDIQPAAIWARK